jgi:ribosomal protein S14
MPLGKAGGTEIEWDTSASGIRSRCESTGRKRGYYKEKHRNFN